MIQRMKKNLNRVNKMRNKIKIYYQNIERNGKNQEKETKMNNCLKNLSSLWIKQVMMLICIKHL